ncbi:hypothetical protein LRR81_01400 [Metabacillus sp. GX 13764]|uniref:hypothetical protein n=1 Tax=Metabacillus kandeliae TaxID=2900151 RepID=UPI001E6166A6|nr:hypothetical protein [Metabacillus kandeliae]MCD7032866.1 hypothetical protein [Metabacillus kandeliae]
MQLMQIGEKSFINKVVEACERNDDSEVHILVNDQGLLLYCHYSCDKQPDDIKRFDGTPVKIICVFGKELINDFHYKAGNDDLTRAWLKKAVKAVIKNSKEYSESYYRLLLNH